MSNKTAILFFARSPEAEAQTKHWTKSKSLNLQIANSLYLKVSKVLAKSELPVFISNQQKQKGQNFQERITNALSDFFEAGYDNAIVVGSDCADLSVADIEKAKANLQVNNYTFGASFDGGVYLFTLAKKDFTKEVLLSLPWCTNQLSLALIEKIYASSSFNVKTLRRKADIDSDLNQLRPFLGFISLSFRQMILNALRSCDPVVINKKITFTPFTSFLFNKGSPIVPSS